MQTAILLICDNIPSIRNLRKEIDSYKKIPIHITLAYLKDNYDLEKIKTAFSKSDKIQITLNDISCDKKHLALYPNSSSTQQLNSLNSKIKDQILRQPKNGYHLSIAYSGAKEEWDVYKSEDVCAKASKKIDLPIDISIREVWVIQKDKKGTSGRTWMKIEAIKLGKPVPKKSQPGKDITSPVKKVVSSSGKKLKK